MVTVFKCNAQECFVTFFEVEASHNYRPRMHSSKKSPGGKQIDTLQAANHMHPLPRKTPLPVPAHGISTG